MKLRLLVAIFIAFSALSCETEPVGSRTRPPDNVNPIDWEPEPEEENPPIDPETPIETEVAQNDPKNCGLNDAGCASITEPALPLPVFEIPPDLPVLFDLSADMPPVRSQGAQGSCVAWATTYYLKSYQEKIQYGHVFTTFDQVMSPAYVYNQAKEAGGCDVGTCIENALHVLKAQGACTWAYFPYNPSVCTYQPGSVARTEAEAHKISDYYAVYPLAETGSFTTRNVVKAMIATQMPVVIGMKLDQSFRAATPRDADNRFVYLHCDSTQLVGSHAMLVVGYDDDLAAFKVVNSWGTDWGNEGYCWVSYDFFRQASDPDYEYGLLGAYIAYDAI
ncbi:MULTISPECIES: C1 family peptidase [unclassified Flavobacterium]|uniref:C1 family peptidase n=1 Tax=unclassified Flavobacterium TaxID=196869 RepID=UPI001F129015|nr:MULTISPECIES: C1 family peptidase [unclassified Flavobacterium]UMY66827.1 C1 family peptidase [Flavobacterium sp. HJ-32-4]